MKAMIIYDISGRIYSVNYGEINLPVGLKPAIIDIPENVQSIDRMEGDTPVYTMVPETLLSSYEQEISKLHKEINDANEKNLKMQLLLSENLTDEQALVIPDIYPEWSGDGVSYRVNERVNYKKSLWRVLTAHKSQSNWTPDYSPSLFVKIINEGADKEPVVWEQPLPSNPYMEGDKVICDGKVWVSLTDGNVWKPGTPGTETLWEEVVENE